jgi:hypothetical protein
LPRRRRPPTQRRPYARHIAAFGDDLEPVHSSPDLMVVCVNTARSWRLPAATRASVTKQRQVPAQTAYGDNVLSLQDYPDAAYCFETKVI